MAVVVDPVFGPKPALTLLGGGPSSLAVPSTPFMSNGRSVTLNSGGLRTISYFDIYRTQPVAAAVIRRMAEAIARLPIHLFAYLDPDGDKRVRDRNHGCAQLLGRPRPRQRGVALRWDLALSTYVHGNYVAWKRRPGAGSRARGAPPYELWTLDWRLLTPIMDGQRVLAWRWHGDGIPGLQRNDLILIEDTLHVAFGAPGGGDIGISPLEQLGVTIRSEEALQRYAEASARNMTRFGHAVILDKSVKSDRVMREGVRQEIADVHGGYDKAFKTAVIGGGIIDIKPLGGQTAVEAELVSQRRVNAEEMAAVIGIPAAIAGLLVKEVNYSTIRELHRILYVTSLGGPLAMIVGAIQAQLLDAEAAWDRDDRFLEWMLDEVLKGDAKERWATYAIGVQFGGLTLNDVRRMENLAPYDDPRADEPLISFNNVRPLSAIGQQGTNVQDGNPVAAVVERHTTRAFERVARGVGAGSGALEALDPDRVRRELGADLEAAGLNGLSAMVAGVVSTDLEMVLTPLGDEHTVDTVRVIANAYSPGVPA